jgi:hypothetical protein
MSKQILILDSSQLSTYLECPEKHSLVNIEHLTKSNTLDDPMVAGTLMHKYLELYYKAKGIGHSNDIATRFALAFNPDEKDETDNHDYPLGLPLRKQIVDRFLEYTMVYSQSDYEVATRPSYKVTIDENSLPVDSYEGEPLIEQGFSYELLSTNEYLFILEGRIDFIGSTHGSPLWMDHKLQFRKRSLYKKRIQFRNYSLALGYNLGVINYIRMAKDASKETLVREPISFSSYENRLWREELIDIYIKIAQEQKSGVHFHNRDSCDGKYGYPCQFTSICEEASETTKNAIKVRDFVKRKEWKPW